MRCPICPDFLRRLVAFIRFMRLSLMKGAYADLSSTAWQEIGVKPGFGLSGIPQHSPNDSFSHKPIPHGCTTLPFAIPSAGTCGAPRLPHKGLGFVSSHTDSAGLGTFRR